MLWAFPMWLPDPTTGREQEGGFSPLGQRPHQPAYTWSQLSLTAGGEPQLLLEQIPLDHKRLEASEQEGRGSSEAKVDENVPR